MSKNTKKELKKILKDKLISYEKTARTSAQIKTCSVARFKEVLFNNYEILKLNFKDYIDPAYLISESFNYVLNPSYRYDFIEFKHGNRKLEIFESLLAKQKQDLIYSILNEIDSKLATVKLRFFEKIYGKWNDEIEFKKSKELTLDNINIDIQLKETGKLNES